jgi:hypothetical protein
MIKPVDFGQSRMGSEEHLGQTSMMGVTNMDLKSP